MADPSKAGDMVKKSGVYSVRHGEQHARDHEVTCVAGKAFPSCLECGEAVRFLLVKHATHIGRHEQFKARASSR
jgi:hypothetical protein